ncbi:malonate decarboxylase subunit epsilon, partial [Pseudomonas sp. CrR25]|nr:malonate decarboxylase subunit epsilon [Pseudomonas sp. CrR25]
DAPAVRACLDEAAAVLGDELATLDSAEALRGTRAVQLCLLIAGVAGARLLIQRGHRPDYVAGLSIGAYAAAVVVEALDFADALRLVALRGELMQGAYPEGYGMSAILGLDLARVECLLEQVHSTELPVYLANINADHQLVIAGSHAALAALAERARALGAAAVKPLAVSVPSHCPLLAEPAERLAEAFVAVRLQPPNGRYLSGSSARLLIDPHQLRDDLAYNMCRVVDWQATLRTAYERGVRLHLELPPGAVLSGLARRLFEPGRVIAFQDARLDTLDALLRQEVSRSR